VAETARTYAGESAQERTARRRRALLDAAVELIATQGWRDLRIDRVCQDAGLNKRYFYESFKNVDELAGAVVDYVAADAETALQTPLDLSLSSQELSRATIAALVHHLTDDPRKARVLFGEMSSSEVATAKRASTIRRLTDTVAAQGRLIHDGEPHEEPIVSLTASLIVGGTVRAILDWLDGYIDLPQDQLIEDLSVLWDVTGNGARNYARDPARLRILRDAAG
jgi:AcrR family transcriptional regulator